MSALLGQGVTDSLSAGMTLTDIRATWDTKASQRSGSEQIWQLRLLKDATTAGYNFTEGPDTTGSDAEGTFFQSLTPVKCRRLRLHPPLTNTEMKSLPIYDQSPIVLSAHRLMLSYHACRGEWSRSRRRGGE